MKGQENERDRRNLVNPTLPWLATRSRNERGDSSTKKEVVANINDGDADDDDDDEE